VGHQVSEPKSPVRKRLEKRSLSSPKSPRCSSYAPRDWRHDENSPVNKAKKRRDELLEAQVIENARKVARAKHIARKIELERQQEKELLAEQIEDKLKAADQRRQAYLDVKKHRAVPKTPTKTRQSRKESIHSFESKLAEAEDRRAVEYERRLESVRQHLDRVRNRCDHMRMVRKVQGWWRQATRRALVARNFLSQGNPGEHLGTILQPLHEDKLSFEEIAVHLNTPQVIDSARTFLNALRNPVVKRSSRTPSPRKPTSIAATRSFLAALMIKFHPETVLGSEQKVSETRDSVKTQLQVASLRLVSLLGTLEIACHDGSKWQRANRVSTTLTGLRNCHLAYSKLFLQWKQIDALCMAAEMQDKYVEIKLQHQAIEKMIDESEAQDPGLYQHFEGTAAQLEELRMRARQLLGETQYKAWFRKVRDRLKANDDAKTPLEEAKSNTPLPPSPVIGAINIPSNEKMVHELCLDNSYSIQYKENDSSSSAALFKQLADEIKNKQYGLFISVIDSIKERLSGLTPNRPDLIRVLEERLDTTLLAQELQADAFDGSSLYRLVQFVGEQLLALQAPARQAQTEEWLMQLHVSSQENGKHWANLVPQALDNILGELAYIDLDMANYHLRVLASHLKGGNGIQYLQGKFEQRIANGEYQRGESGVPLATERWFTNAYHASTATSSDEEEDSVSTGTPSSGKCVRRAFTTLCCEEFESETELLQAMPETLREFDGDRILSFNRLSTSYCQLAVSFVLIQQVLRAHEHLLLSPLDDKPCFVQLRDKLHHLVVNVDGTQPLAFDDIADNIVSFANDFAKLLSQDNTGMSSKGKETLYTMLRQAFNGGTLFRTVKRQFSSIVLRTLRDPAYSCGQLLKKINLHPWLEPVSELMRQISAIHQLNVDVHMPTYNKILVFKTN